MAPKIVLIIGGAGAQGLPIVEALSKDPQYQIRVLTRNPTSPSAKKVLSYPNTSLTVGDPSTEASLRTAFQNVTLAFVNLNSFAIGVRAEIYWGMRIYDIAIESGVEHYIWSALPDALAASGYDERYRVGHFEGKARVTDFLQGKGQERMRWSVVTTGPYVEMLSELLKPFQQTTVAGDGAGTGAGVGEEEWVFKFPLQDGAIPFVHLEDVAAGVKWMFEHPELSAGMDLHANMEHTTGEMVARAFTAVTGRPARYESISKEAWFGVAPTGPPGYRMGSQYPGNAPSDPTNFTVAENFGNWWNVYQATKAGTEMGKGLHEGQGLLKVDYGVFDKVVPGRVRSVEEWMRKVEYDGGWRSLLQHFIGEDAKA
ncbi:NAD(P)-binding protein [Amniculicola lignicola CBS 123094]|uniref:NAD(P)-binding protein n=1 Tax=Amniculicola lignicola CBS 123094 TaxID=1392246 RepID=A0A6A5W3S1_9PLEO|nr:NAD(P)-binding protein [Amniculicola lignicola CBS 123094]